MIRKYGIFCIMFVALYLALGMAGCGIFGGGKEKEETPAADSSGGEHIIIEESPIPKPEFESEKHDVEIQTINGSLNWSKGFVKAKGFGAIPDDEENEEIARLLAIRTAKVEAYANLAEIVGGVQVTATTTVEKLRLTDYKVDLAIDTVIRGARELDAVYNAEKETAIVQLGIYLEDVAKAIPIEDLPDDGKIKFYKWESKPDATLYRIIGENKELKESMSSSESIQELKQKLEEMEQRDISIASMIREVKAEIKALEKRVYADSGNMKALLNTTGIVINAAGSNVEPKMYPSIYYEDENELRLLYGKEDGRNKDKDSLVGWASTYLEAFKHDRVRENPLFVDAKALSAQDCSFVISAGDAKILEEINKEKHFLEELRVVIVQ